MLKLLDTSSYLHKGEVSVSIVDFSLEKRAEASQVSKFLNSLQRKQLHTYLHINAMGASEYWGINRNGDNFPEEQLRKYYNTFVTSPAHVFRHHVNKDPKRSFGVVIFSFYNEDMHRVELIAECPDDLISDAITRIKAGDFPSTSMACKTPYDVCSICGNKAHSRQEYCSHLRTELGRLYPDGRRVSALNVGPLRFFDISIVTRGADPTSYILKTAGEEPVVGSAEMAELEGMDNDNLKETTIKFAELIKEVTGGEILKVDSFGDKILNSVQDPGPESLNLLSKLDLTQVLTGMADLAISPSLGFLSELIAKKFLGDGYEGIGPYVEEFLHTIPGDTQAPRIEFKRPVEVNPLVHQVLSPYFAGSSLSEGAVEKRAMYTSGVGYAGLGPHIEPTQREINQSQMPAPIIDKQSFFDKYGKLLLSLGVTALLSKYYITQEIERKFKEQEHLRERALQGNPNGVKIVLIKQGEKLSSCVARDLSKRSLLKVAGKNDNKDQPLNSTEFGAYKATKALLRSTKTTIGNKLATLLKISVVATI